MTRLLCVSSDATAAFVAAADDAGLLLRGRRVLVLSTDAATPEVVPPVGAATLTDRVDDVVAWPELVAPLHPGHWQPPAAELPLLRRLFAARFGAEDAADIDELVLESVTDGVGRAMAALVPDATITLISHGLATYGPPLRRAPSDVTERVERLLYLDLLPGLTARLAPHPDVALTPLPVTAYVPRFDAPATDVEAVLLGTRFAERGLLTPAEQQGLHADAVRELASSGITRLGFTPHPAADPASDAPLVQAAAEVGAELTVYPSGTPHEAWAAVPDLLVAGWAEPALLLADRAVTFDATSLLDRPGPYERPDRIALTITNAAVPHLSAAANQVDPVDLALLVDAVSFCLDPNGLPELRARAAEWVAGHGTAPYLRKKRLAEYGVGAPTASGASSPAGPRRRRRIFPGGTGLR